MKGLRLFFSLSLASMARSDEIPGNEGIETERLQRSALLASSNEIPDDEGIETNN